MIPPVKRRGGERPRPKFRTLGNRLEPDLGVQIGKEYMHMNIATILTQLTAQALRALLILANPGTRLLLINSTCYLIGKTPRRITTKSYDALFYAQCISRPVAIGAGIAECLLTDEGRAVAAHIEAQMCAYCQLDLFAEEEDAA